MAETSETLFRKAYKYPLIILPLGFLLGMIFWGGLNWAMALTNSESFCISCHVMEVNPYKEFKQTIHYTNRTGVRASCPDCHVPRDWMHMVKRKLQATNELYHWVIGSIDTPELFEAKRLTLARQVWHNMGSTNSRECRNCHGINSMSEEKQTARAGLMHTLAKEWDKTCIDCHKGIAHKLPKGINNEGLMDKLHDKMEAQSIECRLCHEDMAGPSAGDGWD